MRKEIVFKALMVSGAMVLVIGGTAVAAEQSKLNFVPSLGLEITSDDNIYKGSGTTTTVPARTDAEYVEDDMITHVKPGLHVLYNIPERGKIDIGYDGDFANYDDNGANDWDSQKFSAKLNYKTPKGIIFDAGASMTNTADPFSTANEYPTAANPQILKERKQNLGNLKLGYDFGNGFKVLTYYNHDQLDYDRDDNADRLQDYTDNEIGVGIEKKLGAKTWAFIRYFNGDREYDGGLIAGDVLTTRADYDYDRINVGLGWDPGGKLSGELNFGQKSVDFNNLTDATGNAYNNEDILHAKTNVTYKISENTSATLTVSRELLLSSGANRENYEDTTYGVSMQHKFYEKFTGRAGISMGSSEYNTTTTDNGVAGVVRDDDKLNYNIGVDYQIRKWLSASLDYRYSEKDSNLVGTAGANNNPNDYDQQLITLGLKATFDKFLKK